MGLIGGGHLPVPGGVAGAPRGSFWTNNQGTSAMSSKPCANPACRPEIG
ncbi:MAG: hypothetical protein M3361_05070 [Candidatus Tectomicrobia bacterium]|nr:hypothetical protein [Candidatus Tectomicrobia bacterium]HEX2276624.1 hypothetical protein [Candidatus Tectomicrobia bacterium]